LHGRVNADFRNREYLTPSEVEKLIEAARATATASATARWS
jgi:hypothetical protein